MTDLEKTVKDYESYGCQRGALGIQQMPEGYALMLNADQSHYFWLTADETEGPIDWNKWRVRRNAWARARMQRGTS